MNKITVLGSLNVDTTFRITRFPNPGETVQVHEKANAAGGKGANQAVAAARSGAKTSFIGQVGNDGAGKFMLHSLENDNINDSYVTTSETTGTGTANIMLDQNGQNCILVYGGANQTLTVSDVKKAEPIIKSSDFIVAQFETPQDAAIAAFKIAKDNGVTTVLNPAPAPSKSIDAELLRLTDLITPNELESASITGIKIDDNDSMIATANKFSSLGVDNVIITIGDKGAFYSTKSNNALMPAFKVKAVDTTAAGDTFIGALVSQLKTDFSNIETAVTFAQHASSLTVQRLGAQPSIPTLDEILKVENNK
ncbi:ribokinase [Lentilactobacillus farraginis]|uniref:Ribokinase n=1 Tax=Lentilactobacillus farraginis DSM 18382 = JCM 14108 TaxID=1423743 RepID=X0PBS7_9LACO|nr:ribokinase [Lentilactobacillus farraginis]KRM11705.1 ribokinase [Lentilactobacillus farraginis DSM 18382 = JCM 14108]GAF37729.1 ribokinase [Lentilactobacillus farraginis DSM 18382 = JCM 14108]